MTVVFGTLRDIGGQLAQGTVTVSSLVTRPAHGAASTVITKERHVLPLLNGSFESPELDPGPVRVEATTGGAFESWEVTLPEDGRHDLATLTESQHVYEPPVVGAAQAAAADAQAARDVAVAARSDAQSARAGAEAARDVAVGAADAADASATAAAGSADGAAASATAAQGHAEDAASDAATASSARDAAVSAASAAAGSATSAEEKAQAASDDATRAETAADRVGTAEAVLDAADRAGQSASDADAAAGRAEGHADRAVAARDGAEAARDEASGMLAKKADLVGGVVPSSQIPAVAMTRPHVVADRAGLLALDVQEGDVGIIPDGPDRGSYMLGTGAPGEFGSWKRLVAPEAPVSSVNGQTGTVTLGAADVGAATAAHTHTTSQITDLPTISPYTSPNHIVQRAGTGNINVPTTPISPSHAAAKFYVDKQVETRATVAEMQARPAMWMWDGSGQWSPPTGAVDTDTVLNTATGEIHAIVEVTA